MASDKHLHTYKAWPLLAGPTGSGTSSVAMELAALTGGAIVGFDAMQVYRKLDIGTAKAGEEDQAAADHYLIDIRDPDERFTVREWWEEGLPVLEHLQRKEQLPIGVGGTPQYVTAMMEGVVPGEMPQDLSLRRQLFSRGDSAAGGWDALYDELRAADPVKAAALHPNDHRRVVRALEIYQLTGEKPSDLEAEQQELAARAIRSGHRDRYPFEVFAINWPRDVLYERINKRVDTMLKEGLLEEARSLHQMALAPRATARQAIGYKEFFAWLDGEGTLEDAIESVKRSSRRYAKRQLSWYRHKEWVTWLEPEHPDVLANKILRNIALK